MTDSNKKLGYDGLKQEFDGLKSKSNWTDIYNWNRLGCISYMEDVSKIILDSFSKINCGTEGHRSEKFKVNHLGMISGPLKTSIFTEKRFCRAFYNKFNSSEHEIFGKLIDYETPLTKPNQGKEKKVNYGEIDLLAVNKDRLFLIEAKTTDSAGTILSSLLQIFTYTYRLIESKGIIQLKKDFNLDDEIEVVPCILSFSNCKCGKQISEVKRSPEKFNHFIKLLKEINKKLKDKNIGAVEFYTAKNCSSKSDLLEFPENISSK